MYAFLLIGLKGNEKRRVMTYSADLLTKQMTPDLEFMKFNFFFFALFLLLPPHLYRHETYLIYASPKISLGTKLLIINYFSSKRAILRPHDPEELRTASTSTQPVSEKRLSPPASDLLLRVHYCIAPIFA